MYLNFILFLYFKNVLFFIFSFFVYPYNTFFLHFKKFEILIQFSSYEFGLEIKNIDFNLSKYVHESRM